MRKRILNYSFNPKYSIIADDCSKQNLNERNDGKCFKRNKHFSKGIRNNKMIAEIAMGKE